MSSLDMFGGEYTDKTEVVDVREEKPKKRKPTQPNGYAMPPGTGPDGKTCRSCKHRYINRTRAGYTHPKCELIRSNWTNGRGSDIKVSSSACAKYEDKD